MIWTPRLNEDEKLAIGIVFGILGILLVYFTFNAFTTPSSSSKYGAHPPEYLYLSMGQHEGHESYHQGGCSGPRLPGDTLSSISLSFPDDGGTTFSTFQFTTPDGSKAYTGYEPTIYLDTKLLVFSDQFMQCRIGIPFEGQPIAYLPFNDVELRRTIRIERDYSPRGSAFTGTILIYSPPLPANATDVWTIYWLNNNLVTQLDGKEPEQEIIYKDKEGQSFVHEGFTGASGAKLLSIRPYSREDLIFEIPPP